MYKSLKAFVVQQGIFFAESQNICPSQIRVWQKIDTKLKQKCKTNSSATTVCSGPPIIHNDLEQQPYDWITALCESEIAFSTASTIPKIQLLTLCLKLAT